MKLSLPGDAWLLALCMASVGLLASGCVSDPPPDEQLIRDLTKRLEQQSAWPTTRAAAVAMSGSASAEVALPSGAGPGDYVRLALQRNPRLAAAEARVRQVAARVPQARSLADPMLMISPMGTIGASSTDDMSLMLEVGQMFPLPQKLAARAQAARAATAAAIAERSAVRNEVAAQARQAFWQYWLARRQMETVQQSRDLLVILQEAAESALRAGRATQGDLLRVATELANLENRLVDLEQDRQTAIAALNRLLDRPVAAALPEPPQIEPAVVEQSLEASLAEAAARNPELAAMQQEIGAARAQVRSARLDDWPDLGITAGYTAVGEEMGMMGEDEWSLGLEVNLPVWRGRRRAAVREANAAVQARLAELRSEQNDVAYRVQVAAAQVDARRRLVELFEQTVLPQAQQTVEATAAAYRAGNSGFLDYVEAWRRLLDFELSHRQAVADLGSAVAELEAALGRGASEPETGGVQR